MAIKGVPVAGSSVVAGGSNSDLVPAGTPVIVFALGVQPAGAFSTAVLTDGGVANGTNNRWSVSGLTSGTGETVVFDPPLLMASGLRLTVTGTAAFGYVQYALKSHVPGL